MQRLLSVSTRNMRPVIYKRAVPLQSSQVCVCRCPTSPYTHLFVCVFCGMFWKCVLGIMYLVKFYSSLCLSRCVSISMDVFMDMFDAGVEDTFPLCDEQN